mmetsp:Transcript_11965/g.36124  ORF Transcript_11965/g.36124 Transcript_11965/m.36124 type:complete len:205 (+) Transcript_11965:4845-5459(+)
MLFLYGFCVTYADSIVGTTSTADQLNITSTYGTFTDVHVMIFIGFGFLMTFLGKYAFGAIGFNFVLAALSIQWGMLLNGFWHEVQTDDRWTWIHLDLHALIEGDFAAGAVLITFGAVLGKTSPLQMVTVVFLELVFYSLNLYVGSHETLSCTQHWYAVLTMPTWHCWLADRQQISPRYRHWRLNVYPCLWGLLWHCHGVCARPR